MTEREELARIIDPGAWEKTYGCWRFADWHECQQKALAKADQWLSRPSPVDGLKATLAEATSATMMAEMRADKLQAENARLREALRPFALFFDAAIEAWSDGCDLDGFDIQEIAASLGLLQETVFNSEVHTDELGVDAQDGDPWFVLSDMASKAIRDARALQAKEPS